MNKVFASIQHFYAYLLSAIPALLGKIETDVQTVENDIGSPLAQAIVKVFGAKGAKTQADIVAIAGAVVGVCVSGGAAAIDSFANAGLDAAAVASIKSLVEDVRQVIGGQTLVVPVSSSSSGSY